MKRTILVSSIAYFFIVLFLYTAGAKLLDVHMFKEQLASSPILGSFAGIISWSLPIGEILLAIMLFAPAWQLRGLYATFVLMSFFTIYVTIILLMDSHLSCSCGGIIEELSPKQHILFNTACVVLCGVGMLVARRSTPTIQFRWLTGTSAVCLFLVLGWTLFAAFTATATVKTGMEGRLLPSFNFRLVDSTLLNTDDIPTGKPLVIIGFSPFCKHCFKETEDILGHMDSLKNARILFVTAFPFSDMKNFYRAFKLSSYPNIMMCRDSAETFLRYFKAPGIPYNVVFDSKKRLKQAIQTKATASLLIQAVAE